MRLVEGAVGDGAALEFLAWLEHLDLPDPEAVLADPDSFVLPERSDRAFAVLTAVRRSRSPTAGKSAGIRRGAWSREPRRRSGRRDTRRANTRGHRPAGAEVPEALMELAPVLRAAGLLVRGGRWRVRFSRVDELPRTFGDGGRRGACGRRTRRRTWRARCLRSIRSWSTSDERDSPVDLRAFPTDRRLACVHRPACARARRGRGARLLATASSDSSAARARCALPGSACSRSSGYRSAGLANDRAAAMERRGRRGDQ